MLRSTTDPPYRLTALLAALAALAAATLGDAATAPAASAPATPEMLQGAPGVEAADVFVSAAGETLVTFRRSDGLVGVRVRGADAPRFGPSEDLGSEPGSGSPELALDADGNALASWEAGEGRTEIARRAPGGEFSTPVAVEGCGIAPHAAWAPKDEVAVVCGVHGPTGHALALRQGPFDSPASLRETLDFGFDDDGVVGRIAYGADGTLLAVWTASIADRDVVRAAIAVPAGERETIGLAVSEQDVDVAGPIVLPDGSGAALVTEGEDAQAIARLVSISAAGVATPQVLGVPGLEGKAIAQAADGTTLVVYENHTGGAPRVRYRVRPSGGELGLGRNVAPEGWRFGDLVVTPDGGAAVCLLRAGSEVAVAMRAPGGEFGPPRTVASDAHGRCRIDLTAGGDALVVWTRDADGGERELMFGGLDSGAPPEIASIEVPQTVAVGETFEVSAQAVDGLGIGAVEWFLGDGTVVDAAEARHAYAQPGAYQVAVRAVDRAGNESTETRTIRAVAPPAGGDGGGSPVPPGNGAPGGPSRPEGSRPGPGSGGQGRPRIAVRVASKLPFRTLLRRGVQVEVRGERPVRVAAEALRPNGRRLARRGSTLPRRTTRLRLRAPRRLVGRPRPLRLRIVVRATDAAGASVEVRRVIRVRPHSSRGGRAR